MGNHEILKGQTDGIILLILSKSNRHTDELKQIIDEKFSTVKIGTLYSVITRLKNQKLINEYRASSIDGSRRKYYQLTDSGKKVFEEKYKDLFSDIYLENTDSPAPTPTITEKTEPVEQEPQVVDNDKSTDYASYINPNATETIENIDFSAFEEKVEEPAVEVEEKTEEVNKEPDFIPYLQPTVLPTAKSYNVSTTTSNFYEKNSDKVINSEYNYKEVLDKLFPKPKVKKVEIFEEPIEETIDESIEIKENVANWNDVYELAEKDGIKIKISSDTNRYQGSKILVNKLNLFASCATLLAVILSYIILTASISNVSFNGSQFATLLGIFGGITAIFLVIFAIKPHNKIKDLPRFINVIEIALIITISTIIICFATSAIREIDFKDMAVVFNNLILPSVTSLAIPLFFIVQYLLSKLDFFQSF